MRVLVLGAGGFLGARLAAQLAASAQLGGHAIDELVLFDRKPLRTPPSARCRLTALDGDLRDAAVLQALLARPPEVIAHLAATLTLAAETDFRQGLETNVLALIALLEALRARPRTDVGTQARTPARTQARTQAHVPMLLFASSISTFGGALPDVVGDDVFQAPTTSYGAHKVIAEQLLADYTRHGFVDARALRLPIVLTHPGPASGSISDQVAALIREPLRGQATTCRMAADSAMAVVSVDKVIESFLHLATLAACRLPPGRTLNLPGLTVTPAQVVQAVARVRPGAEALVAWHPDTGVQRIIDGWPRAFTSERALALGFGADASVDDVVAAFLRAETQPR